MKIEAGQKFILNQFVQSIGKKGTIIEFPKDYKDRKMLQYYLRTGEISEYTEPAAPAKDNSQPAPAKGNNRRASANNEDTVADEA